MTTELPLNKYLSLNQNNSLIQQALQKYVETNDKNSFQKLATSILSLTLRESIDLYEQISNLSLLSSVADSTNSSNHNQSTTSSVPQSCVFSQANSYESSLSPKVSMDSCEELNIIKQHNKYAPVFECDEVMNKQNEIENKNEYIQHSILKKIFEIPVCTQNIQQQTIDAIEAIKFMQIQYSKDRLSQIPRTKLKSEHTLRCEIIDTTRDIKKQYAEITQTMKQEIKQDVYLSAMLTSNRKNRQITDNAMILCHRLQSIINESSELLSSIKRVMTAAETYSFDRQLIFKTNGQYQAKINPWRNKVTDAAVTNHFLNNLNKFQSLNTKIENLKMKFKLHIQGNKYTEHVGNMNNIESKWQLKENEREERRILYNSCVTIQKQYKQLKIPNSVIEKSLKNNKCDITKTINHLIELKYINQSNNKEIEQIQTTVKKKMVKKKKSPKTKPKPKSKKKQNKEKGLQPLTNFFSNINKKRSHKDMQIFENQQPTKKQRIQ